MAGKARSQKGDSIYSNISIDKVWEKLNDWELKEILDGGYLERDEILIPSLLSKRIRLRKYFSKNYCE